MQQLTNFDFIQNNIISLEGNYTTDYEPLFQYIEKYCLENGASTKWVENMLVVYVKNFTELDYQKCDLSEYYTQFLFTVFDVNSTEGDEEYSSVYFGDDVPDINSFSDLDKALDNIINKETPSNFYRDLVDNSPVPFDEPEFSMEDFQNELAKLRISESEFLNVLKIYQSL